MDSTVLGRNRIELRGGTIQAPGSGPTSVDSAPIVIGRSKGCSIALDDKQVSKVHAELLATELGVRIRDLDSRNGTFVGEHRVREAYLTKAATIRCGDTKLTFAPPASVFAKDIVSLYEDTAFATEADS